jgi:hypothetical protein
MHPSTRLFTEFRVFYAQATSCGLFWLRNNNPGPPSGHTARFCSSVTPRRRSRPLLTSTVPITLIPYPYPSSVSPRPSPLPRPPSIHLPDKERLEQSQDWYSRPHMAPFQVFSLSNILANISPLPFSIIKAQHHSTEGFKDQPTINLETDREPTQP